VRTAMAHLRRLASCDSCPTTRQTRASRMALYKHSFFVLVLLLARLQKPPSHARRHLTLCSRSRAMPRARESILWILQHGRAATCEHVSQCHSTLSTNAHHCGAKLSLPTTSRVQQAADDAAQHTQHTQHTTHNTHKHRRRRLRCPLPHDARRRNVMSTIPAFPE